MSKSDSGSFLFDKRGGQICSLSYVHYDINVLDYMMHLQSIQKYQNQSTFPQELIYKFFVNQTSTIYNIEIELFDPKSGAKKRMKAEIFERKEAQEKYDDSIAQGHTAMLMEEKEGKKDIIELNLGNIGVGWKVTIWMKEVQEIESEKTPDLNINSNTMKIFLPSMNYYGSGSGGKLDENVSMDMHIKVTQGKIHKITSPTHETSLEITKNNDDNQGQTATLKTKGMIALSTDFLLHIITIDNTKIGVCIIEKDDDSESSIYSAAISIIPQLPKKNNDTEEEEINTDIIFVLDCSGSMGHVRMENAKHALEESIHIMSQKHLKKIRTNIVKFGSCVEHLYMESVELNEDTKETILRYIRRCLSDMGGTNIFDALLFALKQQQEQSDDGSNYTKQIVLLSDGEDYRGEQIIQYVKKSASNSRIFSFGIGSDINPVFLNQLAYASNGRTIFINDESSGSSGSFGEDRKSDVLSSKVTEQFRYILQKSVTSVDVKFPVGSRCVLRHVPPIYNFQKFSLYYFLDEMPEEGESVVISYLCGSQRVTENIDIVKFEINQQQQQEQEQQNEKKNLVSILSAKRRVLEIEDFFIPEALQESSAEKVVKDLKDEVISLSKKYQFLSSLTSFLLISVNEDPIWEELIRKEFSQILQREKEEEERRTREEQERLENWERWKNRKKGTCYCMHSEVFVKVFQSTVHNKSRRKKMYEVEVGDLVESFDCNGDIVFSEVVQIHTPLFPASDSSSPQKIEILNILCENGKFLKVTCNHYLYVCDQKKGEDSTIIVDSYIMKAAGLIKIGDYLLYHDHQPGDAPQQVKVVSISTEVCYVKHVSNPFVENCRMIVNGFFTSTLTGDHMAENSQFVRLECPISVMNSKEKVFSQFWG